MTGGNSRIEVDLNSLDWLLTNAVGSHKLQTHLPASVLQVLHRHGVVEDPLYRFNEQECRWVAEDSWSMRCDFDVTLPLLSHYAVDLLLSGVDTVADVLINGKHITQLDNAFREFRIPVKNMLHPGKNTLELVFHSAINEAANRAASYPYPVPSMQGPGMLPHYNFLRKPACDFGWDWGPAFAGAGVFGSISIVGYTLPYITGAVIHQRHNATNGIVSLTVDAYIISALEGDQKGLLSVSIPGYPKWCKSKGVTVNTVGLTKLTTKFDIQGCKLWWPAGYGDQNLYQLTVTYEPAPWDAIVAEMADMEHNASSVSRQIGFRHVELVRNPIDPKCRDAGETFFFRVNGVPIFCKGANVIPTSIHHCCETDEILQHLVEDAASGHMNMLRVWGGGLYLPDSFYQECDQLGIMVWQEAMFACSPYPRNSAFLDNVSAEVVHQMRRLGSRACIVIWGFNNEVEQSLEWYKETRDNHDRFIIDYAAVFFWTMRKLIQAELPHTLFLDGSPSNCVFNADPLTKRWGNPNNPLFGDIHFYNYTDDCLDPAIYPRARFVSEFGYMSWPSWEDYRRVTAEEDWAVDSKMTAYRMRHPNGIQELLQQLHRQLRLPQGLDGPALAPGTAEGPRPMALGDDEQAPPGAGALFRKWIYLTQVLQSLCYTTAITHWRRLRSTPDVQCMGVLYWQLNDIAQFPSWSSINHGGRWKLLHYSARRFFAPVLTSGVFHPDSRMLEVHVTNDRPTDFNGHIAISVLPWGATKAADTLGGASVSLHVAANSSACVWEGALGDLVPEVAALGAAQACVVVNMAPGVEDTGQSLMRLHLQAQMSAGEHSWPADSAPLMAFDEARVVSVSHQHRHLHRMPNVMRASTLLLLGPLKHAALRPPGLGVRDAVQVCPTQVDFVLSSEGVAVFVALETSLEGVFSDNCVPVLLPWEPRCMSFFSKQPFTVQQMLGSLTVMSLYDSYQNV